MFYLCACMFIPSLGANVKKINFYFFGEFAYFYPFILIIINYVFYKRSYDIQNFTRRELFGLFFAFFSAMLLSSVFYQKYGIFSKNLYLAFSFFFGYAGSGIMALLLILFSIVLLFPKFVKENFKIEINFDFLLKIEEKFKNIILYSFGGEKIENNKENIQIQKENIKEEKIIIKQEQIEQEIKNTNEQAKEEILYSKSFIYETSQKIKDYSLKASKTSINLTEDNIDLILQEGETVIPERFLKPKNIEEIKKYLGVENKPNLDEPSYKRKNINLKTNINVETIEKIQEEKIINENFTNVINGDKYKINNFPKKQTIQEEKIIIEEKNEIDNDIIIIDEENTKKDTLDFIPVVEEIDDIIINKPQSIHIDEIIQKPIEQKNIISKEVQSNAQLLSQIEQGNFEKPKDFQLPPLSFLNNPNNNTYKINEDEIDKKIYDLLEKLRRFKIGGDVINTYTGPVVTTFEFKPSADVKVSRILNLQDDLAMALKAKSIRIQAPIPGKDVVGIEVPNEHIQTIYLREILESDIFKNAKSSLTIALGKDIVGNPFITDLKKLPHLLIAGTTGSGKSVGINSMLLSLLYRNSPKTLRLMMIDPKMLEFSIYNEIPHLLTPVITDPKKAVTALSNMVAEMERRYRLMANAKTKNIENYNEKMKELGEEQLPFIVVIIDELADLMMTAGKDVEIYIGRLAQMARASGIHLIVATQRPSVDVVTGLIKANLPSRISYKVGQKIDSKVILDCMGAESLLGRGDCLFTPPGSSTIVRLHAPFASEFEIEKIVDFLKEQQDVCYDENFLKDSQSQGVTSSNNLLDDEVDELYEDAKRIIVEDQKTSISYIQRRLNIGYNRAANIIESLTKEGFLSEPDSKGKRQIL